MSSHHTPETHKAVGKIEQSLHRPAPFSASQLDFLAMVFGRAHSVAEDDELAGVALAQQMFVYEYVSRFSGFNTSAFNIKVSANFAKTFVPCETA